MFCCNCKRDLRNIFMILTILDYDQTWCSSGLSLLLMLEVLKVVKEFYVSAGGLLMAIILFYLGGLTIWKILNGFLYEQTVIACFAKVVLLLSADRQLLYMSTCTRTSMKRQNLIHSWPTHLERSAVLGPINSFKWYQLRNTNWTRL